MNPYPSELLVQLAPVMFVAGLGVHAPAETSVTTSPGAPRPSPQDLFEVLCLRLRDAFLLQRKPAVWQSEKVKTFQVILVDKVGSRFAMKLYGTYRWSLWPVGCAISSAQDLTSRRRAAVCRPAFPAFASHPNITALSGRHHCTYMDPEAHSTPALRLRSFHALVRVAGCTPTPLAPRPAASR